MKPHTKALLLKNREFLIGRLEEHTKAIEKYRAMYGYEQTVSLHEGMQVARESDLSYFDTLMELVEQSERYDI